MLCFVATWKHLTAQHHTVTYHVIKVELSCPLPYNEKLEYSDMPGCDVLCHAQNCNTLSHHALPQNIANVIFVNLLLQKYDGICFVFTATRKFIFCYTVSHQGMSTSHWDSGMTMYLVKLFLILIHARLVSHYLWRNFSLILTLSLTWSAFIPAYSTSLMTLMKRMKWTSF